MARALDDLGVRPGAQLKWPNDVLLGGRKVAGVLCEAEWHGARPAFVIVGVGLNVAHGPEDLPERPVFPATSLLIESGRAFGAGRVEEAVARSLRCVARELGGSGWDGLRAEWQARCAGLGSLVSVSQGAQDADSQDSQGMLGARGERKRLGVRLGVLRGLDEDGALLVAGADGVERVIAGDVAFE